MPYPATQLPPLDVLFDSLQECAQRSARPISFQLDSQRSQLSRPTYRLFPLYQVSLHQETARGPATAERLLHRLEAAEPGYTDIGIWSRQLAACKAFRRCSNTTRNRQNLLSDQRSLRPILMNGTQSLECSMVEATAQHAKTIDLKSTFL